MQQKSIEWYVISVTMVRTKKQEKNFAGKENGRKKVVERLVFNRIKEWQEGSTTMKADNNNQLIKMEPGKAKWKIRRTFYGKHSARNVWKSKKY